ncbi:MAG: sensor histidine kinase [Cytophagales bacterium]|nr:sensor histidine kinase [Cytophagales bacterium]
MKGKLVLRQILIDLIFWVVFFLPSLVNVLFVKEYQKKLEGYDIYPLLWMAIIFLIYYTISYKLVPKLIRTRKKSQRYTTILVIGLIWIVTSFLSMLIEAKSSKIHSIEQISAADVINSFIGTLWFIFFIGTVSLIRVSYENQIRIKDIENQVIKAQLETLRYKISPHFLFNTLNNLYYLVLQKSDIAAEIVLKISELMRYMLQDEYKSKVMLRDEIDILKKYIELEQLRFFNKFNVELVIGNITETRLIAPMIFIPFVENSFKHNCAIGPYVKIILTESGEWIKFYVENSKSDRIPQSSRYKPNGFGLENVKKRMELIYGTDNFKLSIENFQHKFCVTLDIRLKTNDENLQVHYR